MFLKSYQIKVVGELKRFFQTKRKAFRGFDFWGILGVGLAIGILR